MSEQAVRSFFRELAESQEIAARYKTLTWGLWLGYRPAKIVAFAAQCGHHFTEEELRRVRLTNYVSAPVQPLFANIRGIPPIKGRAVDEPDYRPTVWPTEPEDPEAFRIQHGRDVEGTDRPLERTS